MIFFLSTSDVERQFESIKNIHNDLAIVLVDEPFDIVIAPDYVEIWQLNDHFKLIGRV